jgi:hypothetical protein
MGYKCRLGIRTSYGSRFHYLSAVGAFVLVTTLRKWIQSYTLEC